MLLLDHFLSLENRVGREIVSPDIYGDIGDETRQEIKPKRKRALTYSRSTPKRLVPPAIDPENLNSSQNDNLVLTPAQCSPITFGCWDYTEVD